MDILQPTVTIATRSSRSAPFLERVLDGLQKQTGAKLIWSIVTQKSLTKAHEKCLERAKSLGIEVHITHAHSHETLGRLANMAINAVASTYVLLHDDDDALNQNFLGPALDIMRNKICVGVACHAAFIRERSNKHFLDFILTSGIEKVCLKDLKTNNVIVVHGLLYTRTAFEGIGGYDEKVKVAEDWLFNINLCKSGKIAVLNLVCANVYLRKEPSMKSAILHTNHQNHLYMKDLIRINEGFQNIVPLEKRINTLTQKFLYALSRRFYDEKKQI